MSDLLPEQQENLETWAQKRDSMLLSISNLEILKEKLDKSVVDASESHSKIISEINVLIGRIEELKKREEDLKSAISQELSGMISEKSSLQLEITLLKDSITELTNKKIDIQRDVLFASEALKSITDRVGLLDKIVGDTSRINNDNAIAIENMVSSVKKGLQEVLDTNSNIINHSNIIINELPKILLESKKVILDRKVIKKHK